MSLDEKIIFDFERGAYFGGSLHYTISESDDCLLFKSRSYNDFHAMRNYSFTMPKWAIQDLSLAIIEVADWKEFYGDYGSCYDGYGWHIEYNYDGLKISSGGYVEYPENYKGIIRKIQMEIERLCQEYDADYSEDRIEERLSL